MAQYNAIKAAVNAYIKANGRKEITGQILNSVLNATIDSLGRFFQFAGEAYPSTDPGTPDQNVTYLAGTAGTYTNFGGLTLDPQEIALLMWDGEWRKHTMLIGIQEVEASVDNQVGTPSVDVNYANGHLDLAFHNMKGQQGETGAAAGFGSVVADVDSNIGTPSVSVETSGLNTSKNFTFHFRNLKGETGVTRVDATIDNNTGVPYVDVSLSGQVLTLAFHNMKGLQGNTGSSVSYPFTLVNNVDTDDATQALSAAMGVYLQGGINQVRQKIDGSDITLGKYIDRFGNEQDADDWGITGFIPYTSGNDVIWKWGDPGTVTSGRAIIFYDSNKVRIANGYWQVSGNTGSKTISAASIASDAPTAAYLRASVIPTQSPSITIGGNVAWDYVVGMKRELTMVENDLRDLTSRVDSGIYAEIRNPVFRNQSYIRYSDGELIGSGTYSDTISFPNLGYKKIKVTIGLPDSGVAAIAFYNGKIGYASTYISGVQGEAGIHTFEGVVPAGCTSIVVTNRNNVLAEPIILTSVSGDVNAIANSVNYQNPFLEKPFMFHFEPDGFIKDGDNRNIIPGECVGAIRMASRLGFGFVEANVQKTSDGGYIVMHGQGGKFGDSVESLDGTDISNTAFGDVTLDYVNENVRYLSAEEKYKKVATIEEFLQTAKECGIGVFLGSAEREVIDLAVKYLGYENVIVYQAASWARSIFKGFMLLWHNDASLTYTDLIEEAEHYGRPFISSISINVINALKTAGTFDTFIEEMHKRGFLVGMASVYQSEAETRDALTRGVDFSGSGHEVNKFIPNYEQIDINGDSSQFSTDGTISGHTSILASGQHISFGSSSRITLGMGMLILKFSGEIVVNFGSQGARSVTSSGEETIIISDYFFRRNTACTITATASTTIEELSYLTSKC